MTITADMSAVGSAVFLSSIARWDDDPTKAIDDKEKHKIAGRVKRALESQGLKVALIS